MNKKLIRKMQTASGGPIKRQKDGYRYIPDKKSKGGWLKITDDAMSDVFSTLEITPNKTRTGSSITRTLLPKSSDYRSAYNPNDIIKGFNALTLGGLNNLSPTQWIRRAYDTGKLLTGNMTWSGYTDSWINGNNGLVSLKFSEKHPYISTGINLVGDAATLGGIAGAKKLTNISKPNVNVTANIGTSVEQKMPALSLEQIEKAFNQARQWHLNRINSPGYKDRALRAGFTEEEIPQLLQLLTDLINGLKLLRPEEVLGPNIRLNHNSNGKISAGYWKTNINGDLKQGISLYDPNMSYDDAVSNFIHEFGHGATFGLNGTETSGYMKALSDQFPLINRAVKYNRSLYPEITAERIELAAPGAMRTGNVGYFASPTEMLSRGYEFMRDYGNNWVKAYKSGELPSKTHLDLVGSRANSNIFNTIATPKGAANFLKNALGISVPLGLGGYGLYNNDNLLQQLQYLKQGGKMNILEFLKNGSGIHIKEKNKGKFTSYCGGKVTNECILKGKNSSNPAIRKRATFAANARKWKHLTGGTLVETLGGGNTITAKLKAKSNLTKRKAPDWDNLDRGYRYLTLDMRLPHDLAIAIMGNVVEESQGNYKAALKNGRGRGLIQWDGRPAPEGRYGQWGSIWASVAKKANVYDPDTDTVKNYWAPWNGLKGELVRLKFISAPLKLKARIYAESYLRPGKPRIADRQLSAMQLDSIYNPKIKNIVIQLKVGGKIDFLSLGGIASGIKNIVNNVGNFMKSDTGKSILSAGSSLLGLGKGISNSGKITDAANEAEEAINALESADRLKSFAEKYAAILLEKLSKPNIDVNGSPIHTDGVNVTNEAYNLAINTFNFDNSKYNQMRLLIKELALQVLNENSSSMIGSVGGLIDSIGGIAGSLLNKKSTTPKTSLVITGNPDSSKQVITTNSGISGTIDDWKKAILG